MGGYESNECWWYLCPPGGSLAHNCYLRPVGWLPGAAVDCKPILDSGVSTLISPPHILSPPAASGQSDDDTFTARSVLEMMMLFIHKLQWLYIIFCDSMKQHGAQEQIWSKLYFWLLLLWRRFLQLLDVTEEVALCKTHWGSPHVADTHCDVTTAGWCCSCWGDKADSLNTTKRRGGWLVGIPGIGR